MSRTREPHPGASPAAIFPERTFTEGYFSGWGDAVEALVKRGVIAERHVLSGETQEAMLSRARERGLEIPPEEPA